jgi:hypothetical protein|tara:strand:- start:512 stop:685 length:174 start_codon:yes stop_codon:yes gene_type:complete
MSSDQAYYVKEYRNMTTHERREKVARDVSNNGKCWWVYQYLMLPEFTGTDKHKKRRF